MKKLLFTLFTISSSFGFSQTNCDSLIINCCDPSLLSNDTLTLTAQNEATMEIFGYPGFRLINGASTIVAEETVNYFGIGVFDQTHYLNVLQPISLPFTGVLELWGGFYDTLYCTYNVTINTNSVLELTNDFFVYPNPSNDLIYIKGMNDELFQMVTLDGKLIRNVNSNQAISIQDLQSGTYFFKHISGEFKPIKFMKL